MFARACIVLLLVLNLGIAVWWAARPTPMPSSVAASPADMPRLQLLRELPANAQLRPAPVAAVAASTPASADAAPAAKMPQCFSFGPFASADVVAARARLQPLVQRIASREQPAAPPHGWRVYLPPMASPEAAQEAAQRIAAAGFSDYMIVRDGAGANSLALGRYSSEASARRRVATLTAAGFAARAEPLDAAPATTWLDVAVADGFDAARAQVLVAAAQRQRLDCARLR